MMLSRALRKILIPAWLLGSMLACGTGLPLARPTATPTPVSAIHMEVTVVYLGGQETPTPAGTPTLALVVTTAPPADTATPLPTATPIPLPDEPTPTPLPATGPLSPTLAITDTQAVTQPVAITDTQAVTQAGPITATGAPGTITLVAPENETTLPASVGGLEFKWQWSGAGYGCRLPDGYGFQIRVWPAVTGYGPLGVMDAQATQDKIACDPDTDIRSFLVNNIKGTPGVMQTGGGYFLWDVAYVQLDPYQELASSQPRLFSINLAQYSGPLDPFGVDLNCSDFPSWAEAQAVFLAAGGPAEDPHDLDPDKDGIACNELQ